MQKSHHTLIFFPVPQAVVGICCDRIFLAVHDGDHDDEYDPYKILIGILYDGIYSCHHDDDDD